jgi:hypothetical protein
VITYRTSGIQVALSIEVGFVEELRYAVEWSKGRGAYCYSCFAGGCPWPAPATRRYLTIPQLRLLRKKRKKRRKYSLGDPMSLIGHP